MMTKTAALALLASAATLAGCQNTSKAAEETANAQAANANLAAPVELPPAESARVTYRCQPNNTTETVVFFQGDRQVGLMNAGSPPLTILKRTEDQGPYTLPADATAPPATPVGNEMAAPSSTTAAEKVAGGTTLTGDRTNVVITMDGQPTRRCKA